MCIGKNVQHLYLVHHHHHPTILHSSFPVSVVSRQPTGQVDQTRLKGSCCSTGRLLAGCPTQALRQQAQRPHSSQRPQWPVPLPPLRAACAPTRRHRSCQVQGCQQGGYLHVARRCWDKDYILSFFHMHRHGCCCCCFFSCEGRQLRVDAHVVQKDDDVHAALQYIVTHATLLVSLYVLLCGY